MLTTTHVPPLERKAKLFRGLLRPVAPLESPRPSIDHLDFVSTERVLASVTAEPHFRPPVA